MFFTVEKIENQLKEIRPLIYRGLLDLPTFRYAEWDSPAAPPQSGSGIELPGFDDSAWRTFQVGETWGGYDRVAWFRTWVEIPPAWQGRKLALRFLVGPRAGGGSTAESLVYVNGHPLQAVDVWHEEVWLPPELTQAGRFHLALRAWSGVLQVPHHRTFQLAQLVSIDEPAERFYFQALTLLQSIQVLDENDLRRVKLLSLLNQAFHRIDFLKPRSDAFYRSLQDAYACLEAGLAPLQALPEIKPTVWGVGHAHIDMAWLWRLCHSREKAVRTFTTALHLMRQYPAYRFMHSSPQLYRFLKQDQPEIFARVKQHIASGQWEVTGGMWVEADTNLTSGESLVRQFLLGRRFIREEFGVEMHTLWLPDVFGYSAALPQIARKCGIDRFLTSKISWSQFNRFPHDTFNWRGIDGTELLTHFVTTPDGDTWFYTYNGQLSPKEVKGIWDNYRQKDANTDLLMLFGWGDGGGGPTREMLESAQHLANLPGIPAVRLGTAEQYFDHLQAQTAGQSLPVWDGELYLEYHRGTYTSQAHIKRLNRQAEALYHTAEWLSAMAGVLTGEANYPAQALRQGWEQILLLQFHDILPGSSIAAVYADARQAYENIFAAGQAAIEAAQAQIEAGLDARVPALMLYNPLPWARAGLVELPWSPVAEQALAQAGFETQAIQLDGEAGLLFEAPAVPALGYQHLPLPITVQEPAPAQAAAIPAHVRLPERGGYLHGRNALPPEEAQRALSYPLHASPASADPNLPCDDPLFISPQLLENAFYRLELNTAGQLTRLWDKRARREVLPPGARANVFQVFEDKPLRFDAWDIDPYYPEKQREVGNLLEAVVEENGPLRGVLLLRWQFSGSIITQRLTLYRHTPRIDFRTQVDWHEQQTLLKVAFPVDVRATRATYDIQFGSLERPTHWNTSWDWARFEVSAHKWVDLSEGDYGVALLNDCKYGHDVHDNVLRLTLIKSAIDPDPAADQGQHTFTYSLLPHLGDWRQGGVIEEAYALNLPLLPHWLGARPSILSGGSKHPERRERSSPVVEGAGSFGELKKIGASRLSSCFEFARLSAPNVILETVKRSEDGGAWIVRLYEAKQCRCPEVTLHLGWPIRRAVECNLVEEDERPVQHDARSLTFSITPFEIKTFKLWPEDR